MKVKMLVAMALSGLLVTSVALAEPAIEPVDDMNSTTMQSPSGTDATTPGSNSAATNSTMANPGAADATPATPPSSDSAPGLSPSDSAPVNSDVSADTATGDDDY